MRTVTHFLAPSRSIRDRFISFGIAPERIEHWPYGFDLQSWGRSQTWGRTGVGPRGLTLGLTPGLTLGCRLAFLAR